MTCASMLTPLSSVLDAGIAFSDGLLPLVGCNRLVVVATHFRSLQPSREVDIFRACSMIGYWHDTVVCLSVRLCVRKCNVAKRYIL